ncbi:TolC family protein [Roseimarinus sediminis]|uniref:TolC family protein n=1 Tax=Roseimarinus sediminis TaxID=1610899 RepID=UPI003D215590
MKIRILFMLMLFSSPLMWAQQSFTLEQCRQMAIANYPRMERLVLLEKLNQIEQENTGSAWLPDVSVHAQATYQSDVIELDLPVPGFNFEPLSNDQYKAWLELKQIIWDGGINKARRMANDVSLKTSQQQLEVEAHQLSLMVENLFFMLVLSERSEAILQQQFEVLQQQLTKAETAVKAGMIREKDRLQLTVEQLNMQQKIQEARHQRQALQEAMSITTGARLTAAQLLLPDDIALDEGWELRPELSLFSKQQQQLGAANELLVRSRYPKLFGFAQAGYGKPGLNMLNNSMDAYYVLGVGLSWKVFDWNNTRRSIEANAVQGEMIEIERAQFIRQVELSLSETKEDIEKLKSLIDYDVKVLKMRADILRAATLELENGTITASDYLGDLNAETIAKINREIHQIQLLKAKTKYNSLLGL